jgi:hypothetical protein
MIEKLCWRVVSLLGELLGRKEREAVLGDFADCKINVRKLYAKCSALPFAEWRWHAPRHSPGFYSFS